MYTAENVRLELEVAKREFLQASVGIHGSRKVNGVRRRGELVLYSSFCLPIFVHLPTSYQVFAHQLCRKHWSPYSYKALPDFQSCLLEN